MNTVALWAASVEVAPAAWPLIVVGIVAIVLVIMLVTGSSLFRGTRALIESLWCPFKSRLVRTEFEIDAWNGRRIDVTQCSAFTPPTAVTCDKRCLDQRSH